MPDPSINFSCAITRLPATTVVDGLRAAPRGTPDIGQLREDHAHYAATLRETGAEVVELPPLARYPDAVFVEDTALCLPEGAVLMRPGAPSRAGEVAEMAPTLREHCSEVREIMGPGFIEGGDILATPREILVGRSSRTNAAGVAELMAIVGEWDYTVREVHTPEGVLHFKTDCSLLDVDCVLATPRLAASGCFEGYRVIDTCAGEEAAANAIRFNRFVLMAAGFPRTAARVRDAGFDVREINNSECAKLDGGMSCLSLRLA